MANLKITPVRDSGPLNNTSADLLSFSLKKFNCHSAFHIFKTATMDCSVATEVSPGDRAMHNDFSRKKSFLTQIKVSVGVYLQKL